MVQQKMKNQVTEESLSSGEGTIIDSQVTELTNSNDNLEFAIEDNAAPLKKSWKMPNKLDTTIYNTVNKLAEKQAFFIPANVLGTQPAYAVTKVRKTVNRVVDIYEKQGITVEYSVIGQKDFAGTFLGVKVRRNEL